MYPSCLYSPQNGYHSDENKHSTHNIPHMKTSSSNSHTVILDIADIDFQIMYTISITVTVLSTRLEYYIIILQAGGLASLAPLLYPCIVWVQQGASKRDCCIF